MNPKKFQVGDGRRVINGPRPLQLSINKDSYMIKKETTPENICVQFSGDQKRSPVIIYTHSPKVIHAQPRDFMRLVQKLTGLSRSEDDTAEAGSKKNECKSSTLGENNDLKVMKEENGKEGSNKQSSSSSASLMNKVKNSYLYDIPLYTPNSSKANSTSPTFFELLKGLSEY